MTADAAIGDGTGDDLDDLDEPQRPAPAGTVRSGLLARLAKVREELHLDIPVPRTTPPVMVRYVPIEERVAQEMTKRSLTSKDKDATVNLNANILARYCRGIWMLDDKGNAVSVFNEEQPLDPDSDELPTFKTAALVKLLDGGTNAEIVRKIYATDGDVLAASITVQNWSGQIGDEIVARQQEALDDEEG